MLTHPAVDDCAVQGHFIDGVGHLPRAYVVLKYGYTASADELLQFVQARVLDTERLRGGVVFIDKLPKDPTGKLFVSLSKYDSSVEGVDEDFLGKQQKVVVKQVKAHLPYKICKASFRLVAGHCSNAEIKNALSLCRNTTDYFRLQQNRVTVCTSLKVLFNNNAMIYPFNSCLN